MTQRLTDPNDPYHPLAYSATAHWTDGTRSEPVFGTFEIDPDTQDWTSESVLFSTERPVTLHYVELIVRGVRHKAGRHVRPEELGMGAIPWLAAGDSASLELLVSKDTVTFLNCPQPGNNPSAAEPSFPGGRTIH